MTVLIPLMDLQKARSFQRIIVTLCVVTLLGACSAKKDLYEDRPVGDLYREAMVLLEAGNYPKAAEAFDKVEQQHPYSEWAAKAQLMSAFCHYKDQRYEMAVMQLETFNRIHPGHPNSAYAHYLIGLCYYEEITDVKRDQKATELAMTSFQEVVRRFPGTKYAKDAKLKIDLTEDHLAGKEADIGRYYLKRDAYLAAINRFRKIVEDYQNTSHVPEALLRLTEAYVALGLHDEAQAAAAVLGHNYPGSTWYADSYYLLKGVDLRPDEGKAQRSWMNRILGKRLQG